MRQLGALDEIRRMEKDLPARDGTLMLAAPMVPPLKELKPEELDLVQIVHNDGRMKTILDKSPTPDLETYEALLKLLKGGFIQQAQ